MAKVAITEKFLEDIADAIREKLNTQSTYKPSEMAEAISSIIGGSINLETKTKTYTPLENIQTETITASSGYDGLQEVDVTVNAISSTYVGSEIERRTSSDLTASGAVVTAPAGYYSSDATKTITSGTAGTPTATKGTVSNHSISITPSVTNTSGYITGSTKTGTAVNITASELVSGTLSITENDTGIDVTNYANVNVNVEGGDGFIVTLDFNEQNQLIIDKTLSEIQTAYNKGLEIVTVTPLEGEPTFGIYSNEESIFIYGALFEENDYYLVFVSALTPNGTEIILSGKPYYDTSYVSVTSADVLSGVDFYGSSGWGEGTIPIKSSSNLTVSGSTVTAPSGYYANAASKSVASGTEGIPTATKGSVLNHSISITPSVTNVVGYISGGTHTGTAVTVSASELVSGSETKTQNGTYDVTNLASLIVNVSGGGGGGSVTQDQDGYIVLPATGDGGGSGGSSNFVQGTFTTSETAGSIQTINIPYTGNGYPVTLMIYPSTGMAGGDVGSLIQQYAVISYWMVKTYISSEPTYSDTSTPNHGYVLTRYKNTSNSSTSHATSSGNPAYVYSTSNPASSGVNCVKFSDDTTLKILIASGSYGFPADKEFTYQVVYSE